MARWFVAVGAVIGVGAAMAAGRFGAAAALAGFGILGAALVRLIPRRED